MAVSMTTSLQSRVKAQGSRTSKSLPYNSSLMFYICLKNKGRRQLGDILSMQNQILKIFLKTMLSIRRQIDLVDCTNVFREDKQRNIFVWNK